MTDTTGVITWSTAFAGSNFTTFGEDINGALYVAGGSSGVVSKVVDTSLGVATFNKMSLQLYPNPASSEVFVQGKTINFPALATVYDMSGKLLMQQSLSSATNAITTTALQSGLYMVSIKDQTGLSFTSKLTIK